MFVPITGKILERFRRNTNRPDAVLDCAWLTFYDNADLVRITDEETVEYFIVAGNGDLEDSTWFQLDGSSDPIHDANKVAGLRLTEETVLDYLRFFCDFLDMQGDRFRITGNGAVKCEGYKIVPVVGPVFNGVSEGRFLCSANAIYGGAVYAAEFAVSPEGTTEMLTDTPIEPVTLH